MYNIGIISGIVFRDVEKMLKECIACLEVEERGSYRGIVAARAAKVLPGISELIQFSAFL